MGERIFVNSVSAFLTCLDIKKCQQAVMIEKNKDKILENICDS